MCKHKCVNIQELLKKKKTGRIFPKRYLVGEGRVLDFSFCILQLQQNNLKKKKKKGTVASQLPFQTFGPEQLLQRIVKCNRRVGM